MPQGIHHFIEHMLFESGADDLSRKFMAANAMVNAYTTTNRTVYFFHTTDAIDKPLGAPRRHAFPSKIRTFGYYERTSDHRTGIPHVRRRRRSSDLF
ncbi:MAG: insulinase family protein [Bacillus subtilis]|nr:insulinase family protein [Bacillus subtilis]